MMCNEPEKSLPRSGQMEGLFHRYEIFLAVFFFFLRVDVYLERSCEVLESKISEETSLF